MSDIFDMFFDLLEKLLIIVISFVFLAFLTYIALLNNITSRITKEAEITGVISSSFVNMTYNKNPLSKIPGEFRVIKVEPAFDTPVDYLGDRLYIEVQKEVHLISNIYVPISSKASIINQGFYGRGYR